MDRKSAHPAKLSFYFKRKVVDTMTGSRTNVKMVSIICTVDFLACLLSLPVIRYVGGRQCMPLIFFLFPAEVIPWGVGFVTAIFLIATLTTGRDRKWPLGALAVIIGATVVFWFCYQPATIFLYGMRDRFVAQGGYPAMRQFAQEFSQNNSLSMEQEQWDDLVTRYPFLRWKLGARAEITRQGAVRVECGSPLVGHWGFEVAGKGTLSVPDKDRGQVLKVADDIQFFFLYD